MEKRGKPPEWWVNRPILEEGDNVYLDIWKEADTARPSSFSSIDPIPFHQIHSVLELFSNYIPDGYECFFYWAIRSIDNVYIKYQRKLQAEKEKKEEAKAKQQSKKIRRGK